MSVEMNKEDKGRKLNWLEACAILNCSRGYFYKLVERGVLPSFRIEGAKRGLWVYEKDVRNLVRPGQKN